MSQPPKLTPTLIDVICHRIDGMREQEWRPEAEGEFRRSLGSMRGSARDVEDALDNVLHERKFRPTIAEFDVELTRARVARARKHPPKPETESRSPTSRDRAATRYFTAGLKQIIAELGSGPQTGAAAKCEALNAEWKRMVRDSEV